MILNPLLLAIDTSSRQAGVALFQGGRGLLAEYNWHSANRHTEELIPALEMLLAGAGCRVSDLTAIAVALGPGSFSGLRVGLAAAKGLAVASRVKLLGVSTLDVTAFPHHAQPLPVVAVVQAGRGRLYSARYEGGVRGPYRLSTPPELAAHTAGPVLFVGELTAADRAALTQALGEADAQFLPSSQSLRRAGCLAELAWRRFERGEADDAASLSPLYLQQPDGAHPDGAHPDGAHPDGAHPDGAHPASRPGVDAP
jgi:tRNA threonylcarbamoyladenosine biosynthesis protein TsaB